MIVRKVCLILLLLFVNRASLLAQNDYVVPGTMQEQTENYRFSKINFGIKAGFTSSLFLVSDLSVNEVAIEEVQNNYKIGYFVSAFMRYNIKHFFLQPEVSYAINRCQLQIDQQIEPDILIDSSKPVSIDSKIHSIDIPLLVGYNLISEYPYSMAVFAGPKFRYILNNNSEEEISNIKDISIDEEFRKITLSMTLGVNVTISKIFFDFRYDIGCHNISKKVNNTYIGQDLDQIVVNGISPYQLNFKRRDNILSFSLGLFF